MSVIKSPTMILGVAPPHPIDQSIRFNDDDSAYLHKTWSGAGDKQKFTFSFWVKRANITSRQILLSFRQDVPLEFEADDTLRVFLFGTTALNTNRVFRDQSAFYHILLSVDSTNILSSDRVRLYVNGERETSFSTESYPSLNASANIYTTTLENFIGRIVNGSNYFDGYMAEIAFIDGSSLEPSSFGLVNSSGIWIPRDLSGISFGSNGYHLKGENASDLGNDSSGNNNDFTTSGLASHDQMVGESPTNNFCTGLPIGVGNATGVTFSNGNLDCSTSGTAGNAPASISLDSGKWYYEINFHVIGSGINGGAGETPNGSYHHFALGSDGNQINTNGEDRAFSSDGAGTIAGFKLDIDGGTLEYTTNGTNYSTVEGSLTANTAYAPYMRIGSGSGRGVFNFGQDSTFGGLETAGGNSDGNGIGDFYYNVPSNFSAICTKNLGS